MASYGDPEHVESGVPKLFGPFWGEASQELHKTFRRRLPWHACQAELSQLSPRGKELLEVQVVEGPVSTTPEAGLRLLALYAEALF